MKIDEMGLFNAKQNETNKVPLTTKRCTYLYQLHLLLGPALYRNWMEQPLLLNVKPIHIHTHRLYARRAIAAVLTPPHVPISRRIGGVCAAHDNVQVIIEGDALGPAMEADRLEALDGPGGGSVLVTFDVS